MNKKMFALINGLAGRNSLCDHVMIMISKYMIFVYIAAVAAVFLSGVVRKKSENRKIAVNTAVFTGLNLALNVLLGTFFYVKRPFVDHKVNLLYPHVPDSSFPSDHATGTLSITFGLWRYNSVLGAVLTIFSLVVGFSRVYVGHHYPADVLGSYLIVAVTDVLYQRLLKKHVENLCGRLEARLVAAHG